MKVRIPDFVVTAHCYGNGSYSVDWIGGDRRYHFWIDEKGDTISDVLHSNPLVRNKDAKRDEHRGLSLTAKKWAPMIEAMLAQIKADDLVAKAKQKAIAEQKAEQAERTRKINEEHLAKLYKATGSLPRNVARALLDLSTEEQLAFIDAYENT